MNTLRATIYSPLPAGGPEQQMSRQERACSLC